MVSALDARFAAAGLDTDDRLAALDLEIERAAETLAALQLFSTTTKMEKNRRESRILSLPPEIMVQIFRWSSLEKRAWLLPYAQTYPRLSDLVSIAAVCREWRLICHSSPALWSDIDWQMEDIDEGNHVRTVKRHLGRCMSLSGPSRTISLSSSPPIGSWRGQGWEALSYFVELYGSKLSRLGLGGSHAQLFLGKFDNIPNLRSLTIIEIPWFLIGLPSATKLYPLLDTIEVINVVSSGRLGDHWDPSNSASVPDEWDLGNNWGPSDSFLAQYNLEHRSSAQILKLLIAAPDLGVTILFILPVCQTLVHLHLGQMTCIPSLPQEREMEELLDKGRTVQEILLPCLLTLHFTPPNDRASLGFFEKLRCPSLRRVRCTPHIASRPFGFSSIAEPDRTGDALRWAICCFLPPTETIMSQGSPSSIARLFVMGTKYLQEDVADVVQSVASASSENLTIVTCAEHNLAVDPAPALDLDMQSSWIPCPGDPFWDRYIQSIIRLPGSRTADEPEGRRFEGIPKRWRPKCHLRWDEVLEAAKMSTLPSDAQFS